MLFENTWNQITAWFHDRSERAKLVRSFNEMAKAAFVTGLAPTALKASMSRGVGAYRHEFSAWLNTGFRIQALSGRQLTKEEMMFIGQVVLGDTTLVRRLVVLGWDTLEVHDNCGHYGCRWKLIDYAEMESRKLYPLRRLFKSNQSPLLRHRQRAATRSCRTGRGNVKNVRGAKPQHFPIWERLLTTM